jgi:hypothetical protein
LQLLRIVDALNAAGLIRSVVAADIIGQLGFLVATGRLPLQPPAGDTMRGIDFYPWRDFIRALIKSVVM